MTQEEIVQYNKLCAEFLGYVNLTPDDKDFDFYEKLDGVLGKMLEPKSMKFHSDWNWIMVVVDAIEKLGETDKTYGTLVDITTTYVGIGKVLIDLKLIPITKKEAVVEAINQFLIWYEQNK